MSASARAAGRREPAGGSGPRRGEPLGSPGPLLPAGGPRLRRRHRSRGSSSSAALGLQAFILPRPSAIVDGTRREPEQHPVRLLASAQATLIEALGGLRDRRRRRASSSRSPRPAGRLHAASLLPLAVAANAVPIIAFAPLMNNWFGLEQSALEDDDGGGPRVLPGDGQRHPRARPGRPARRSS